MVKSRSALSHGLLCAVLYPLLVLALLLMRAAQQVELSWERRRWFRDWK